jgi:hypothetical protein
MKVKIKSLLFLLLGLLGLAAFVFTLHFIGPNIPGPAGEVLRNNIENDIEATALFYSESGDIRDYLDSENGRYGNPVKKR